jgi:sugar-specific transcriptional regulator TrmB
LVNQPPETAVLQNLGLNRYEAGAYVALTRRGRATGAEVARIAGLPRQRIYDVLDGLVGRGLATVEPGRPAYYAAVDPDQAVTLLLDAERTALVEFEQEAARAVALLAPAYRDGRAETDPLSYIEVLREPAAIAKRFGELQSGAQKELLIFTKPP